MSQRRKQRRTAETERMNQELEALYARVPDIGCKGLCADACGPIDCGPVEHRRLRQCGVNLPSREQAVGEMVRDGNYECPALKDGRCSVYTVRPMICRWWGAMVGFRCPHGCRPLDKRLLSEAEGLELLDAANKLGTGERPITAAEFRQRLQDPRARRIYDKLVTDNQPHAIADRDWT